MEISIRDVKNLVNEPYFSRGTGYFEDGMVKFTSIEKTRVTAITLGTRVYETSLFIKKSGLDGACSCPAYDDYGPCKHMAATGLALIAYKKKKYVSSEEIEEKAEEIKELEKVLMKKTKAELVAMLLDFSHDNPYLFEDFN